MLMYHVSFPLSSKLIIIFSWCVASFATSTAISSCLPFCCTFHSLPILKGSLIASWQDRDARAHTSMHLHPLLNYPFVSKDHKIFLLLAFEGPLVGPLLGQKEVNLFDFTTLPGNHVHEVSANWPPPSFLFTIKIGLEVKLITKIYSFLFQHFFAIAFKISNLNLFAWVTQWPTNSLPLTFPSFFCFPNSLLAEFDLAVTSSAPAWANKLNFRA